MHSPLSPSLLPAGLTGPYSFSGNRTVSAGSSPSSGVSISASLTAEAAEGNPAYNTWRLSPCPPFDFAQGKLPRKTGGGGSTGTIDRPDVVGAYNARSLEEPKKIRVRSRIAQRPEVSRKTAGAAEGPGP